MSEWLRLDMLAERWRDEPAAAVAPAPAPADGDDPLAWCARLYALSLARFGEGAAITRLVDELGRLAIARFDGDGDGDHAALDARIEELIAHVEDLADAAELAGRRR